MDERVDLTDPSFEPSDAHLQGLSTRAFAGVAAAHELALKRLRAEIAGLRAKAMQALDERADTDRDPPR